MFSYNQFHSSYSKIVIPVSVLLVTMAIRIPYFQGHGNESQNEIYCLEMDKMIHTQLVTNSAHHVAYLSARYKDYSSSNVSEPTGCVLTILLLKYLKNPSLI